MELLAYIVLYISAGVVFVLWALGEYEDYKDYRKNYYKCYIKSSDFLKMEDNTKVLTYSFSNITKTGYIRPGSYIQNINCYQAPISCDETKEDMSCKH